MQDRNAVYSGYNAHIVCVFSKGGLGSSDLVIDLESSYFLVLHTPTSTQALSTVIGSIKS